jgi:hypothetical protein
MNNRQKGRTLLKTSSSPLLSVRIVIALILTMLALVACSGNVIVPPTSEAAATSSPQTANSSNVKGYPIKVYFSKFPESETKFDAVFPVDRVSPTLGVANFALQLLIAGPTTEERNAGYFSELNSILTGPSTCSAPYPTGGPDFKLALNMKGATEEQGTATVRFCRATSSPGIGADARIQAEINATLKQFPNIKKVVILDKDGHCFADGSGQDRCLK